MPKVSVIIPNYKHAEYLAQRIDSVLAQSFRDFELIILDDASPDNSQQVIEGYLKQHPEIRHHFNTDNSGSPFAQWNRGCKMARGEYLWFAESDDYCEPELLQELVPLLDQNPNVGIAYAQSYLVNESGEIKNSYLRNYEFVFPEYSWEQDFIKDGKAACKDWLVYHNPIPNASAALIRRSAMQEVGGANQEMRLNGDWHLYAKILSRYDLAFCARHLNYFRVHEITQRARARSRPETYRELIATNRYLKEAVPEAAANADEGLLQISNWWMDNLYHYRWTRHNRKVNRELYRLFSKQRSWLAYHIAVTYGIKFSRSLLYHLRLLEPAKQVRKRLFPGKYFEY